MMKRLLHQLSSTHHLHKLVPECAIRTRKVGPQNTILLVIDMQEYFRSIADPIISNIVRLVQTCREIGVNVIL